MSDQFTCPLSPGQEQVWFLQRLAPDQCAYNLTFGIRLHGELDASALTAALTGLVCRHETLRTTIDDRGARPLQLIADVEDVRVELPVETLGSPTAEPDQDVLAVLNAEAATSFDPRAALFRARLFRLSAHDHLLSLSMHHLISDAGSYRVLMQDLGELYRAERAGVPALLAELRIQYADYAVWQRDRVGGDLVAEFAHWQETLRDVRELEFRTDRNRPAVQSFRGETIVHPVPPELVARVDELSRTSRGTPFMTLVAAFQMLLARHTGQDEIVIGSLESGRTDPDLDLLVGLLVNSVVLRTDLSGDPSFGEALRRARGVLLEAADHANVPFDRLVEQNPHWRRTDRNPLFQVAISQLPEYPDLPPDIGVDGSIVLVGPGGARFDLNLNVHRQHAMLSLYVEYATDLFDRATVHRLLEQYERVLWAVTADPSVRLSAIPLLSEQQQAAVLALGLGERRDYPRVPVHQLVAEQASRTPRALAVDGEQTLTYAELDRRSDLLARFLRRRGLRHQDIVGVAIERNTDALVAYLAVTKAGGAYLPLDPGHPAKRLEYLVDDARAGIVLTHAEHGSRLPAWPGRDVLEIDHSWPDIEQTADDPLPEWATERSLAYLLYTSGSTGNPKGVMVEHGALSNYITWFAEDLPIRSGDRMFQYFSLVFDVAHGDIFATLAAGATSVLVPPSITLSPPALGEFIRDQRCTYVGAPPAMLGLIPPGPYPDLASVLVVGEPFPGTLVNRWNLPGRSFLNLYGPTEATVGCTSHVCAHREWRANPPIGRPIHNTRIYVVDRWRNPVPAGVPGEILIAGDGLARGYLGRPELTADRFIDDPFVRGARAYRSGDRACWTEDGLLTYLGRMDNQVKIRSQRVELGEIEGCLAAHAGVRQVAVTVRETAIQDKRLIAYVVPVAGTQIPAQELRDHVARELPSYMIPSDYIVLDRLPLGPSGKVDRKALPEPFGHDLERVYTPPRTAAERAVASAFATVLGLDKVSADADFFAMGGTSLQVAAVISQLKQRTSVSLALRDLYAQPTVEAVAAALTAETPSAAAALRPSVVVLRAGDDRAPLFCLPHVFGDSLAYRRLLPFLPDDQPLYSVEPPEPSDVFDQVQHEKLTSAYVAAIRTWQPNGPYHLTGHSMGGTTAFEMALQLTRTGAPIGTLILVEPSVEFGQSTERGELGRRFVDLLAKVAERPMPAVDSRVDSGSDGEFLAGLLATMRSGGLAGADMDTAALAHRYRAFSANLIALRNYLPREHFPGRIVLVRSATGSITTRKEWERRCGHVDEIVVPGDHFSMWNEPHVAGIAGVIASHLDSRVTV